MQETQVQSLGQEDLLEKEMATHSSVLAWEIRHSSLAGYSPWGRERVRCDSATKHHHQHHHHYTTFPPCVPVNIISQQNKRVCLNFREEEANYYLLENQE